VYTGCSIRERRCTEVVDGLLIDRLRVLGRGNVDEVVEGRCDEEWAQWMKEQWNIDNHVCSMNTREEANVEKQ